MVTASYMRFLESYLFVFNEMLFSYLLKNVESITLNTHTKLFYWPKLRLACTPLPKPCYLSMEGLWYDVVTYARDERFVERF